MQASLLLLFLWKLLEQPTKHILARVRDVEEAVLILMVLVDGGHERSCMQQGEAQDGLLKRDFGSIWMRAYVSKWLVCVKDVSSSCPVCVYCSWTYMACEIAFACSALCRDRKLLHLFGIRRVH